MTRPARRIVEAARRRVDGPRLVEPPLLDDPTAEIAVGLVAPPRLVEVEVDAAATMPALEPVHHVRSLAVPPPRRRVAVRTADGIRLNAEVFGPADAPAIVLSHGITSAVAAWTYQIHGLSDRFQVIAYDQRGHGRSERPHGASSYSIRLLGQDLQAVLAQCLRPGQPAILAGHSMGGIAIMSWAQEFPTEVTRRAAAALLMNTAAHEVLRHTGGEHLLAPIRLVGRGAALAPVIVPPFTYGSRDMLRWLTFGAHAEPGDLSLVAALMRECPGRTRANFVRHLMTMDLRGGLPRLTVPTVVMAGAQDRMLPAVHSTAIVAGLPQVLDFEILPGVGHMAPLEAADHVTSRLADLTTEYAG